MKRLLWSLTVLWICSSICGRGSAAEVNTSPNFSNKWVVQLHHDADPFAVARDLNMENLGPVTSVSNHYVFLSPDVSRRSKRSAERLSDTIALHSNVIFAEQETILKRVKRSTYDFSFNDEYFPKQWYLYEDYNNVTGAWNQGVTGKDIVVTILDDGIERTHPDLRDNYDPGASIDLNDHDDDPMPRYDINNENKHGTRCAGEVASVANNKKCGVGAAYKSRIGGVRMLDGDVTDSVEANAIGLRPEYIDIYSASWGPDDDGKTVDGPGRLTVTAFEKGIKDGRNGLGCIFVWASGNGGVAYDNCNCDGYTNSIWTLSIGSASEMGKKPWYAEECSSTMAVTYSSGSLKEKQILTTDLHSRCTERHTGTSAAAPMAAGMFALVLQANPLLTWRDLQHLVVRTSRERNLQDPQWTKNGVGRKVSHKYGYGIIDAGGLVELALKWNNVPRQLIYESPLKTTKKSIGSFKTVDFEAKVEEKECEIRYLEHLQAVITIAATKRGDIKLTLTSPAGTTSTLLTERAYDKSSNGFNSWPFLTVHNWGENPIGTWKLTVQNLGEGDMKLMSWNLRVHGTETFPDLRNTSRTVPESGNFSGWGCDEQCDPAFGCSGAGPGNCTLCKNYLQQSTGFCTSICEAGEHLNRKGTVCVQQCDEGEYVTGDGQCDKCNTTCNTCDSLTKCTSCSGGLFLNPINFSCDSACPKNMLAKGGMCKSCHSNCLTCTDTSYDSCITCQDSLFSHEHKCLQTCPTGFYGDGGSMECKACNSECKTCTSGSDSECISCYEDKLLAGGKCVGECPSSFYPSNGECAQCHWTCSQCHGVTLYDCDQCRQGLYKMDKKCIQNCPAGFRADTTTGSCVACPDHCQTCFGALPTQCYSCKPGYKIIESAASVRQTVHSTCKPICSEGSFISEDESCIPCNSNCTQCFNATACTACVEGLVLAGGNCIGSCPGGHYDDDDRVCLPCSGVLRNCKQCKTAKECTKCEDGYDLSNGECISSCKSGQFVKDGSCEVCSPDCRECSGGDEYDCLRCSDMMTNSLIEKYQLKRNIYCGSCSVGCELCARRFDNYCVSCHAGKFLLPEAKEGRASCVEVCPNGTYEGSSSVGVTCLSCDDLCEVCSGSNQCLRCTTGYVLENGKCLMECTDGFYKDSSVNTCKPCDTTCKTCNAALPTSCLTCPPDTLHQLHSCVTTCDTGYYKSEDSCLPCHHTCSSCVGGSETQCQDCKGGLNYDKGLCKYSCELGTYRSDDSCQPCHVTCNNCTGGGLNQCLSCKDNLIKNPSKNECWECCSETIEERCCYCDSDPGIVKCRLSKDSTITILPNDESTGSSQAIVIFLSALGVVLVVVIITLLLKWRRSQSVIRYSLLSSFSSDHRWDDTEVMVPT